MILPSWFTTVSVIVIIFGLIGVIWGLWGIIFSKEKDKTLYAHFFRFLAGVFIVGIVIALNIYLR